MIEDTAQSLKVEQDDMGTVLDAASKFKPVKLALVATGENSSPFKGHQATGRSREYLTSSDQHGINDFRLWRKRGDANVGQLVQGLKLRTGEITVAVWLLDERFY